MLQSQEKKLSHDETRTLLDMVNPVQGIEEYHVCVDYLKIDVVENGFSWKKRRYNTIYRSFLGSLLSIQYFIGAIMFFCPIFYAALQDTFIGSIFRKLKSDLQVGLQFMLFALVHFLHFPA
ncbi:hypothetical protein FD733_15755 [Pantoea sp. Eser]|nr:hypothetical protein [Pantoea sp. Eser]